MFEKAKAKFADRAGRILKLKTVRRFRRQEDGAAAVEFALVAAPFLALLFAIMESAGVFFAGQALETATADSARLIMTGQAQTQGFSETQFKAAVCGKIYALFDCNGGVYVDVKKYSSFSAVNVNKPIDANGNLVKNFTYDPGGPGCIVVVRLLYEWPVYLSLAGLNLADLSNNKRLLVATSAFRNEPFASTGGC
jgi:Flp pilus assembly protein TadG